MGIVMASFLQRNEKECQTTKNPFPELLRVRAEIFKKVWNHTPK